MAEVKTSVPRIGKITLKNGCSLSIVPQATSQRAIIDLGWGTVTLDYPGVSGPMCRDTAYYMLACAQHRAMKELDFNEITNNC